MPRINPQIQPWTCPYCRRVNPPKTYDCKSCGAPLLEEYVDYNDPNDVPYGNFDSPYFIDGGVSIRRPPIGTTYTVWL